MQDSHGDRYVLRRCRRNPNLERIEFQACLQQRLFDAGLPTAPVIKTGEDRWAASTGDEIWVCFGFVDGGEFAYSDPDHVREAARWLIRFHRVGERITPPGFGETVPDVRRWWLEGDREISRLGDFFAGALVGEELNFLREWHEDLIDTWKLSDIDGLQTTLIHGDYHGRNMVFVGARLAGVFDFDVVHRGFRVEDVAMALYTLGRKHHGSDEVRLDAVREFAAEYPTSERERSMIPMMMVLIHARRASRYALRQRGGEDAAHALRRHVRRMRALQRQVSGIESALQ